MPEPYDTHQVQAMHQYICFYWECPSCCHEADITAKPQRIKKMVETCTLTNLLIPFPGLRLPEPWTRQLIHIVSGSCDSCPCPYLSIPGVGGGGFYRNKVQSWSMFMLNVDLFSLCVTEYWWIQEDKMTPADFEAGRCRVLSVPNKVIIQGQKEQFSTLPNQQGTKPIFIQASSMLPKPKKKACWPMKYLSDSKPELKSHPTRGEPANHITCPGPLKLYRKMGNRKNKQRHQDMGPGQDSGKFWWQFAR